MIEETISNEQFEQIIKKYGKQFNDSGYLQMTIPQKLTQQNDINTYSSNFAYTYNNNDLQSINTGISDPIWNLLNRGGKRWRPILCVMLAECYGKTIEDIGEIAALCEIVHNGTLIVDDIEDSSEVRRGEKCVHLIYGIDISINAGNLMYFAPLNRLLKSEKYSNELKLKFSQIYAEEMTALHLGQAWDIVWHNPNHRKEFIPSEDQYLQMTAHKTGVLARLSTRLVCAFLGLSDDHSNKISQFAEKIGVAFQIQDDILNLSGADYLATKGQLGEDIHEGKMSLMVINCLQKSAEEDKLRLLEILGSKTNDQALINEAIALIKKSESIEYSRQVAIRLIGDSWNKNLESILPNNLQKKLLKKFAEYTIGRSI